MNEKYLLVTKREREREQERKRERKETDSILDQPAGCSYYSVMWQMHACV